MNKKKITAFAMATLAACSMSSIMAFADDQVTITMVESLTSPERTAILREIADNYQADHPDVTIEIVSPPLENADTKITQMLMNGSGADIVEVRDSTISTHPMNGWQICSLTSMHGMRKIHFPSPQMKLSTITKIPHT